jgi:GalNAc5-diNAcBac-PP-undecaprenol beta-1,3-glucosyltransferase
MIDATVLIPTYRHAALLRYAAQSALAQEGASVELFVLGDGVEDDTRAALEPFLADPRVRFFDLPKGERHGERNRHTALAEAAGRIVCYLSDDDLLLPSHVSTMLELLEDADFAHSAPFFVKPGDVLAYIPFDLSKRPQQARLRRGDWNAIGLTGAAHTLAAYRRLPWGWRPAPTGVTTDLHMWLQFVDLAHFRGVTGTELTHLHFPSPLWSERLLEERVSSLVSWSATIHDPAGRMRLARRAQHTCAETAADFGLWADELNRHAANLEGQIAGLHAQIAGLDAQIAGLEGQIADRIAALATLESSRTWRLRNRLLALRPVRALVARLPEAR